MKQNDTVPVADSAAKEASLPAQLKFSAAAKPKTGTLHSEKREGPAGFFANLKLSSLAMRSENNEKTIPCPGITAEPAERFGTPSAQSGMQDTAPDLVQKAQAGEIYGALIGLSRTAVELYGKGDLAGLRDESVEVVDLAAAAINAGNKELLNLSACITKDSLASHLANTCVLSLHMGTASLYGPWELRLLGTAALFHELTPSRVQFNRTEVKKKEFEQVAEEISSVLASSIFHKERNNAGGRLPEFAALIVLTDIYEKLIHPVKKGARMNPHEALKMLIRLAGEVFNKNSVRLLLEELSFYPQGSYVRLNDGRIARVVRANKEYPTRPVVQVVFDRRGAFAGSVTRLDLSKDVLQQISSALDEEKLPAHDKLAADDIYAHKWWNDDKAAPGGNL